MFTRRATLTGGAAALVLGGAGAALWARRAGDSYERFAADLRRPMAPPGANPELIRHATLAASGHNTQPWLFRDEAGRIAIQPDFSRRTPVVDPDDHHLYVSLGCAVENLSLAAAATGRPGTVAIEGDGRNGPSFVFASGAPDAVGGDTGAMAAAISLRQSTRGVYDGRPAASADLQRLQRASAMDGVDLALLTERRRVDQVRDLVVAGNDVQMADPAFMRELKDWLRFSPISAMTRGDGLYAAASGNPPLPDWLGARAFDLVFKPKAEADKYARQIDSSAGLAVFSATQDDPAGWIAVGRACQRFCLMATALGLKTAFVNQPVEVVALRGELASLSGLDRTRRPDLVLRFGYGPALAYSPRRPVEAVLAA